MSNETETPNTPTPTPITLVTTPPAKLGRVLSAADLFSGGTPRPTPVSIPEIPDADGNPGTVYVRAMSARDVLSLATLETKTTDEQQSAMIQIITKSVVNEDGTPMFPTAEDAERLRDLSFKVFNRLTTAVNEVAGVSKGADSGKG